MTETSLSAAPASPPRAASREAPAALSSVPVDAWSTLIAHAAEANVFFDPAYALAATRFAHGGVQADALCAHDGHDLLGLLPVTSALRAYRLPVPALVSNQPYTVLGTPLLRADRAQDAADRLLTEAARRGAHVLSIHMVDLAGPAVAALRAAADRRGLAITVHRQHERAALVVPDDAEAYLRAGMGSKKLKELRRLRHRLDEDGAVEFSCATTPEAATAAVRRFLALEASGWKGQQGTSLGQDAGDARFILAAAESMAARGAFEVLELTLDDKTIASGIILKQAGTALFFKITYDEAFARYSPGVQLTVELTRRFAEDPAITYVDSSALPGHPMIDHVWRERRQIGDLLIAVRPGPIAAATIRTILLRDRLRETAKHVLHTFRSASKPKEKSK